MTPGATPRHVHANVPISSAADLGLKESPVADGIAKLAPDQLRVRGRETVLGDLQDRTHGTVVLTGPAGIGKTTVAGAAVQHRSALWVSARERATLIEGMAAVAGELSADGAEIAHAREAASTDLVWRLLTGTADAQSLHKPTVLIIDDVDDPDLTTDVVRQAQALPASWLTIVTSRFRPSGSMSNLAHIVEVDRLPSAAGANIVLDRIPAMDDSRRQREFPHAERVAKQLGCVPLALHVAGSYLGSTVARQTPAAYSDQLAGSARRTGLRTDDPAYFLLPAIDLTLQALGAEERESALRLLGLLAAGAPGQPFPLGPLLATAEPSTEHSLRLLAHTGLVDVSIYDRQSVVVVPPLIARAVGHVDGMRTVPDRGAGLLDEITTALDTGSASYLKPGDDTWPLWRLLIPHLTHLLDKPASRGNTAALCASHRAVHQLLRRGMHRSATDLAVVAAGRGSGLADRDATIRRTALLDRGLARKALAMVTLPEPNDQSDLARAFDDINDIAQNTRRTCHPDDPEAMQANHQLATILHETGKLADSEHLFEQVLEARRRVLGEDHADTLITKHNLAAVLLAAGHAPEAEQMLKIVLAARERDLGINDPSTVTTRHSLAYAHQAAGGPYWLEDAKRDFGEVLAQRRVDLGTTHPDTLITMHNVAWLDQARGHFARAEHGFRNVLATQIKRLGKAHPHTVAVAANLAWVLLLQRQFPASRRIFTQVLKVRTIRLGTKHPDSQTTRGNLGWLTYEEGYFHLAEHRFRRLYEDRKILLGDEHPRTLTTRHNLALSLRSQRELLRARDVFIQVLDAQVRVLTEDHDSTLATKYNYAVTLRMLNSSAWLAEAMTLLNEVLNVLSGRQDPHNPLLRQTKREIVTLLAIDSGRADVHELVDDSDEAPEQASTTVGDPLIQDFVDDDIDDFPDPDLTDYAGSVP